MMTEYNVVVALDEQVRCVKREIALRKCAYPKMVASGRMDEIEARLQLASMTAVLRTLQVLAEYRPGLFDQPMEDVKLGVPHDRS